MYLNRLVCALPGKFLRAFGQPRPAVIGVFALFFLALFQAQLSAAITFVGATEQPAYPAKDVGNPTASNVTVAVPAGTQAGDFMFAAVSVRFGAGVTINTPSGWTAGVSELADDPELAVFYRIRQAGEVATDYNFTWNLAARYVASIVTYRGVDSASPVVAGTKNTGKSTTPTALEADRGLVANTMVVRAFSQKDIDNTTLADFLGTLPTNTDNERAEVSWTEPSNKVKMTMLLADKTEAATGNTPQSVLTTGKDKDWTTATVVLRPSPQFDYGDAPVGYGSPSSDILAQPGLFLGVASPSGAPDGESANQSSAAADGDNTDAGRANDEQGVTFSAPAGVSTVNATVNFVNTTGGSVQVCGWLDVPPVSGPFTAADGQCQNTSAASGTLPFAWSGLPTDALYTSFARFRISTAVTTSDFASSLSNGETEDYQVAFDFRPTVVTIGRVELREIDAADFLAGQGVEQMDDKALLDLLASRSPELAGALANADRVAILNALAQYLDPDGDGAVAALAWETLAEFGTLGFYVERMENGGSWVRINKDLLRGLITAPMGGEYLLADPEVQAGHTYQYRLIEQEAAGTTRTYGPYSLEIE